MIDHFIALYCGNTKTLKWLFRVIHNGLLAVEFDYLVLPPRRRVCLTEDLYLKCKRLWTIATRWISRRMSAKTGLLAAGKNTYVISGVPECRFVSSGLNHVIWHGLLQQRVAREQDSVTSHWQGLPELAERLDNSDASGSWNPFISGCAAVLRRQYVHVQLQGELTWQRVSARSSRTTVAVHVSTVSVLA